MKMFLKPKKIKQILLLLLLTMQNSMAFLFFGWKTPISGYENPEHFFCGWKKLKCQKWKQIRKNKMLKEQTI